MKKLSILTILFLSIMNAQPGLEVPGNMSFQGFLTDSEGVAYADGEYNLTFRLIHQVDQTTENTIWEESHSASVTNGVFSVILGSVTPLPLNFSPNVQLETQVGDEILSPRQSLTSVPFALKSSRAQQAFQSVLSDTAMIALNAPMADTAQFSYHALDADHADSSMHSVNSQHADHASFADSSEFSLSSQHSVYADTAGLAIGIVGGIDIQHVEHATYADTANYALGIVGGIEVDDVQNATYADTAYYVEQAQNALTANEAISAENSTYADTAIFVQQSESALTANEAISAINSTYADTAYFVQESQSSLIANEATTANNSTYADTAYYVQEAQSALTAVTSQNSTNATYADTAEFVDLSQHGQNMQIVQADNAQITLRSSGDGSASFLTLIAKEPDGDQTELRVMNEGNTNELKVYDATNDNYLMTVGSDGKVTATSFVGDGSGLTGISSVGSLTDLGLTATTTELNYVDGVTSSIQDQINANVNQVNIDGGNLSVGTATMNTNEGADNTVFGSGSMYTNTSGSYNTAIGRYSLTLNTTGDRNNGLGNNSLYNNTTGSYNVGIGNYALFNNTTAGSNVAVGDEAMFSNLSGSNNTAIGGAALRANTTGGENSAFGYLALKSNTTGTRNTALGLSTLFNNLEGTTNIAIGREALYNNTTGSYNTILGSTAGFNNTTGSRNVFIGYDAGSNSNHETASDKLVIANSNTTTPLIEGDFDAATLKVNGILEVTGHSLASIANIVTSTSTFSGIETIVPVSTENGDIIITIDSSQNIKGRIITFKQMGYEQYTLYIQTSGGALIQNNNQNDLGLTDQPISFSGGRFQTKTFFCDGVNWYHI